MPVLNEQPRTILVGHEYIQDDVAMSTLRHRAAPNAGTHSTRSESIFGLRRWLAGGLEARSARPWQRFSSVGLGNQAREKHLAGTSMTEPSKCNGTLCMVRRILPRFEERSYRRPDTDRDLHRSSGVDFCHMRDQVYHSIAVSPFIIVPAHELHKGR
jgi:hypothetical protein